MKKILVALQVVFFLLFSACATTMAPSEQRRAEFVEKTNLNKGAAYSKVLAWLGKNFGDANAAIKVRNEAQGQIVAQGNVACNSLRQWGDTNEYLLKFNLDVQTKDNKVRMVFEELTMDDPNASKKFGGIAATSMSYLQLTDADKVEKVKPCLEPIRQGIIRSLGSSDNW